MDNILNKLTSRLINNHDKIVHKTSNEIFILEKINNECALRKKMIELG